MSQLSPWWERQPEVLQHEKDWLEYLGFDARLDEQLLADANVVRFHASQTVRDQRVEFDIVYPDLYPYFKVEITTEQEFANHHHPFEKLLCLLRGGSASWDLSETAAQMIAVQLPKVIDDQPGEMGDPHSDGHAEPRSNYFRYAKSAVVRTDGAFQVPDDHDHGTLVVGCDDPFSPQALRGTLLKVRGAGGATLWEADPSVARLYGDPWQVKGRWTRTPGPPTQDGADAALLAAQDACPAFVASDFQQLGNTELEVTGLVFAEEVLPDTVGDGWMFVVRHRATGPAASPLGRGRRAGGRVTPKATVHVTGHLVQGHRSGRADVRQRTPTLEPLADKGVAVIGAGGLGAPSVIELAKAGVGFLETLDRDVVDAATAARWPLGYLEAGHHKIEALGRLVARNWPYTDLRGHGVNLGAVRLHAEATPQWGLLAEALDGVDLIYDAAAEVNLSYLLSRIARERGIPHVCVTTTNGAVGGRVSRYLPGENQWCWGCMMHHTEDGTLPLPPAAPPAEGTVHPAGCADPTFTGTGFDVGQVALAGVRLAASTLCDGTEGAYPATNWDVAILSFQDDDGFAVPGSADTYSPGIHPDCELCNP